MAPEGEPTPVKIQNFGESGPSTFLQRFKEKLEGGVNVVPKVSTVIDKLLPRLNTGKDGFLTNKDGSPLTEAESILLYIKATHGEETLDKLGKPGKVVLDAYQVNSFVKRLLDLSRQYAIDLVPMLEHYEGISKHLLRDTVSEKLANLGPGQRRIIKAAKWAFNPGGQLISSALGKLRGMTPTPSILKKTPLPTKP